MTEAMPFLRKPILLSYDPRPCRGAFLLRPARRTKPQIVTFLDSSSHLTISDGRASR